MRIAVSLVTLLLLLIAAPPAKCQSKPLRRSQFELVLAIPHMLLYKDHTVVKGPDAMTAALGTNASFTCVVEYAELWWTINNIPASLNAEEFWKTAANPINGFFRGEMWSNSTVTEATLLVSATVHNNRTSFGCSAFGGIDHSHKFSPMVQLTVFGIIILSVEYQTRSCWFQIQVFHWHQGRWRCQEILPTS